MQKYLLYSLLLIALFSSCQKVIQVDVKNAAPQIVIEGIVNNANAATVIITKSVKLSENNTFPPVPGATVNIQDNAGNNYLLTETNPGIYKSTAVIGVPGRAYTLRVVTNNTTYTAVSTMPQQVNFDDLVPDQLSFGSKTLKVVRPRYKDPVGQGNSYQFIEYLNGVLLPDIYTWNDIINNGGTSDRALIYIAKDNKPDIVKGDQVKVEMRCIDPNIYTYMRALADLNSNSTTPANPPSNLTGGSLGYFSAHTSQTRQVTMP